MDLVFWLLISIRWGAGGKMEETWVGSRYAGSRQPKTTPLVPLQGPATFAACGLPCHQLIFRRISVQLVPFLLGLLKPLPSSISPSRFAFLRVLIPVNHATRLGACSSPRLRAFFCRSHFEPRGPTLLPHPFPPSSTGIPFTRSTSILDLFLRSSDTPARPISQTRLSETTTTQSG